MPEPKPWPPLWELSRVRLLEFLRTGEAVFWTFMFPVVMAFVLGIAFRNSGPEKIVVGVEQGHAQSDKIAAALERYPDMLVRRLAADEIAAALRTGRVTLAVKPAEGDAAGYI